MPWRRSGKDPDSGTPSRGTQMKKRAALSALIIPLQQIVGHSVKDLGPFAEGAQRFARFFGQLLGNPSGTRQSDDSWKGRFFGGDIFPGAFAQLFCGLSDIQDV